MGASSSFLEIRHIHISLSTKFADTDGIVQKMVGKLKEKNIEVTVTNNERSIKEVCELLKKADIIFYCCTQNYGQCSNQALEYSYLIENKKVTYDIIIDNYKESIFTEYMQSLFDGQAWEITTIHDFQSILKDISVKHVMSVLAS